jgi:hypothetical protein
VAEIGEKGFFVEGPADEHGNRAYSPAVVKGEVVKGPTGGPWIGVTEPPEFPWPVVPYADNWLRVEGPARMITSQERDELFSRAGSLTLPEAE